MADYLRGDTLECAGCGHCSITTVSEYPPLGIPPDKIHVKRGTRLASMVCTNPACGCYTIYAPSAFIADSLTERFKSKKT
jgi:hypothetical protein